VRAAPAPTYLVLGTLPIPPPPDPGLAEASRSREEGAVAIGGTLAAAFHLTLEGAHDCIESSDTKRRDDRRVRLGGKRPGST
jgi:hypothetical protein